MKKLIETLEHLGIHHYIERRHKPHTYRDIKYNGKVAIGKGLGNQCNEVSFLFYNEKFIGHLIEE